MDDGWGDYSFSSCLFINLSFVWKRFEQGFFARIRLDWKRANRVFILDLIVASNVE